MDLARRLLAEARAADERRLLVLAGDPERTRASARSALEATDIDPGDTTYVGPAQFHCESLASDQSSQLLGTTRTAVVLDCHDQCSPSTLGQLTGAVDGGGLLILLTPPLSTWPTRRDAFDETLAVPPFDIEDVTGHFRTRLVEILRQHRGIAIVDVDSDTVESEGLVDSPPRHPPPAPTPPADRVFPRAAYEQCLTQDQVDAVAAFEALSERDEALVVSANRGRGKSSAAGLAAAALAADGHDVLVTAPQYRSCEELFARADALLDSLSALSGRDSETTPQRLATVDGCVRYEPPESAVSLPGDPDRVIVDEAAALPVRRLSALLDVPSVAFTTTIHGYEGAGRGFSVRFRDHLTDSRFDVTDVSLATPIRFAPGDPVEVWSFRALALDASPPVGPLVADARPATVAYRELSSEDLLADERLLSEVFGLLVDAHYRTEPDDLARLLDGPNISVHALCHEGHVVSVALLAREGGLSAELRAEMYAGSRIRGNLVPDVLTSQLRDEAAGGPVGQRVLRIATHERVRSRGLGSTLLAEIESSTAQLDWLGVGYGATPELVDFWAENGYSAVHLSTTRNDRSGEHSAVMLNPLSDAGSELLARHTRWFIERFPDTLTDAHDAVDPDVVRAVCRAIDGTPDLSLSEWEWRHATAVAVGPGIVEMAPGPIRHLAFRHLVDPAEDCLTARQERLLVRRVLQNADRERLADEFGFPSTAEAMRELGEAVDSLVDLYGPDTIAAERDRLD